MYGNLLQDLNGWGTTYLWGCHAPNQRYSPFTRLLTTRVWLSERTCALSKPQDNTHYDDDDDDDCDGDSHGDNGIPLVILSISDCPTGLDVVGVVAPLGSSDENVNLVTVSGRSPIKTSLSCGVNYFTASLSLSSTEPTQRGMLNGFDKANTSPGKSFASFPLHREAFNHCATQQRVKAAVRIQVGVYNCIPRWVRGSKIKYIVDNASFGSSNLAITVANSAAAAAAMWQSIGATFEFVPSDSPATFQIKYRELPFNRDRGVYAEAFFPQDGAGTLFVYRLALAQGNIEFLANILAHELGHVLGLRHEHASEVCEAEGTTKEPACVRWGFKNETSVMNNFPHLKNCVVKSQDLAELKSFYDFRGERYGNMEIRDFVPQLFQFAKEEGKEAKLVPSSTV